MDKKKITKKEEFEEEIRVFKKNENATYDILALCEYFFDMDSNYEKTLVACTLAEKVIDDLEDPEINVSYKSDNEYVPYIISKNEEKFYEIIKKYRNVGECKELYDKFFTSYKEQVYYRHLYYNRESRIYNSLMDILLSNGCYDIIKMFLTSNISLGKKTEIFTDLLQYFLKYNNIIQLCKLICDLNPKTPDIKKIIDEFDSPLHEGYNTTNLVNYIIDNKKYGYIPYLQEYFNFNKEDYLYKIKNNESDTTVSLIGKIAVLDKTIRSVKELYESDSYMKLPKKIRFNNDLVILENITEPYVTDFISLSHFEITDEKIDILVKRILSMYFDSAKYSSELVTLYLNQWSLAILHKSKNKNEYKVMLKYVKKLEEKVKTEMGKKEIELKELEIYRSILVGTLKELENKMEDKLSEFNLSPKNLKQVLSFEDLNENKN